MPSTFAGLSTICTKLIKKYRAKGNMETLEMMQWGRIKRWEANYCVVSINDHTSQ